MGAQIGDTITIMDVTRVRALSAYFTAVDGPKRPFSMVKYGLQLYCVQPSEGAQRSSTVQ